MIGIPQELKPASLLWADGLSQSAMALTRECSSITAATPSRQLEFLVRDAEDLHAQGDREGCATVLLCLADQCRESHRLGPALKYTERAEQLFCCWRRVEHIHNHATALYSLGLLNQLLGLEKEALDCYDRALTRYAEAETRWAASCNARRLEQCQTVEQWIRRLRYYVAEVRMRGGRTALHCSMLVGYCVADTDSSEHSPPLLDAVDERIATNLLLRVNGRIHELQLPGGGQTARILFPPGGEYSVVKRQQLMDVPADVQDASYLLVQKNGSKSRHFQIVDSVDTMDLRRVRFIGDEDSDQDTEGSIIGFFG